MILRSPHTAPPPVPVRLGPDEGRRLRAVRLRALADAPDAFWRTLAEEEPLDGAAWARRLVPPSAWWVVTAGGRDVGLVGSHPYEEDGGLPHLVGLWVDRSARGTGAADALVRAVVDGARAEGADRLLLWTTDGNEAALALYRRHGFVPTGRVGTFPEPRGLPELQLSLALDAPAADVR